MGRMLLRPASPVKPGPKHNAPNTYRDRETSGAWIPVRLYSVNRLPEAVLLGCNAGAQAFEMDMRSGPFAAQISLRGAGGKGE